MRRTLYTADHEAYRETVREFLAREVVPHHERWDSQRWIDRSVFAAAAKQGIYGLQIPEAYGGAGEPDYRFRMIVAEECSYDRHEACHAINLFDMHQKYADVLPLAEVLQWMRDWRAAHPLAAEERPLASAASR